MTINANSARKMTNAKTVDIKNSPAFKYVMARLESYISEAIESGYSEVKYNFYAMRDENGDYPSSALRKAVADELRSNGYVYWEFTQMTPNGSINSCFGISW